MSSAQRWSKFSLRTLFIVSVTIALPFLILSNVVNGLHPENTAASPVYLVAGVLGMLAFSAVGGAVGQTKGAIGTAVLSGLTWLVMIYYGSRASKLLASQFPLHVLIIVIVIAAVVTVALRRPEVSEGAPDETLERLLENKKRIHASKNGEE